MNNNSLTPSTTEQFFGAYLWAVTTAAAAIPIVEQILRFALRDGHVSAQPLVDRASSIALFTLITFVISWIFAFSTAIAPGFIAYFASSKWGIKHAAYFTVCGALTGAITCPILLLFPLPADVPNDPPLMESYLGMLPIFLISGSFSGLTFWYRGIYQRQSP